MTQKAINVFKNTAKTRFSNFNRYVHG